LAVPSLTLAERFSKRVEGARPHCDFEHPHKFPRKLSNPNNNLLLLPLFNDKKKMVLRYREKRIFLSLLSRSIFPIFSSLHFCGGRKYKKKLSPKAIGKLIDLIFIDFNTHSTLYICCH
jgi:hypothetical protein